MVQKEAKEQAEEENIVRDTVEVKIAKIVWDVPSVQYFSLRQRAKLFRKEQQVSSTARTPTTEAATGADSKDPVRSSVPQQNKKQPGHQPENWRAPARELAKGVGKAREPQKGAQASQSVFFSPSQVLQATSKERWTPGLLEARAT